MVVYAIIHIHSFNTQPPEGGWFWDYCENNPKSGFNTQPPEGGWLRRPFFIVGY